MTTADKRLTPPQLAKLWGVGVSKIHILIQRGKLHAFDISLSPGQGRPRWRIDPAEVERFEYSRTACRDSVVTSPKRQQRRQTKEIPEYV